MNSFSTKDNTQIYFKVWGTGKPVVFCHGWPLSADAWDSQMLFLALQGYRCVAHDRRGHGRSDQPWDGNDMDTYADDLSELIEKLDLKGITIIGHSTGGGEVARFVGRHGTSRIARIVLLSAVTPLRLKTKANPEGTPIEAFDKTREGVAADRSQFYIDLTYECIKAFSETDFTEDLKKFDVPTLIIHGDDDQIVPIDTTSKAALKIIKNATLKIYLGGSHGLAETHKDKLNYDLLSFIKTNKPTQED